MAQRTFKPLILTLALLLLTCPASAVESLCSVMVKVDKAPEVSLFREVGDDERLQLLTRILYEVPGVDLKGSAAQKNRGTELTEIIEWVSGVKGGTLAKLYNYIRVSRKIPWLDWLNQSGLDGYRIVGKTDGAITDKDIVHSIQALEKAGRSISQKDFATDRTEESRSIIEAEIGKALTPSQILTRAESFDGDKGTWDWWLKQAGFEPELIRQRRSEIPEKELPAILLALEATKVDLNAAAVSENRSGDAARKVFQATGYALNPSQIHTWVTQHLERPWIPTLHEAGVDLSKIDFRNTGIGKPEIVRIIEAMDSLRLDLSPKKMEEDNTVDSSLAIYKKTGIYISPNKTYRLGLKRFNNGWWGALEEAGKNPSKIFQYGWLTDTLIVQVIEAMDRANLPLNVNSVYFYSEVDLAEPLEFLRRPVNGRAILYRAGLILGSWDLALVKAGLNPDEVRKQGWADLSILSEAQLQERRRMLGRQQSLERRTVVESNARTDQPETVVVDDALVEDHLIRNTVENYMSGLGNSLDEREVELFEYLLQAVVKLSVESGGWGIHQVIVEVLLMHPETHLEEMQSLIVKISEESDLAEVLGRF